MNRILARWEKPYGDRRQEIVLIGIGLDREALTRAFGACLLTGAELQAGAGSLALVPRPVSGVALTGADRGNQRAFAWAISSDAPTPHDLHPECKRRTKAKSRMRTLVPLGPQEALDPVGEAVGEVDGERHGDEGPPPPPSPPGRSGGNRLRRSASWLPRAMAVAIDPGADRQGHREGVERLLRHPGVVEGAGRVLAVGPGALVQDAPAHRGDDQPARDADDRQGDPEEDEDVGPEEEGGQEEHEAAQGDPPGQGVARLRGAVPREVEKDRGVPPAD